MTESTVWEVPLPEVSLAEVYQAEGADYGNRPPRPRVVEVHRSVLAKANTLVHPVAIWCEVDITGTGQQEILLEEGQRLTGHLLARLAGSLEKLVLVVMTLGRALDDQLVAYNRSGNLMEALALDATGTACLIKSSWSTMGKIEELYHATGLSLTFPMGPGHSYWGDLRDMQTIFHFLQPERIGLTLTAGNLMIPRKSVAMVLGVGKNLADLKGKTHCDFCNMQQSCRMSKFGAIC